MLPSETTAVLDARNRLAHLIGSPSFAVKGVTRFRSGQGVRELDALIEVGPYRFAIEYKQGHDLVAVANAVRHLQSHVSAVGGNIIPLVVVPFMSDSGRRHCEELGVARLVLSGNARIEAPGLRIWIEGRPNQFKERGRPSNVFAPKSARLARWLLVHPNTAKTQRELAIANDVDEGQTSRIVSRLLKLDLARRDSDGAIRASDRALLLDAWHDAYDFSKPHVVKGHIVARTGEELLTRLANLLESRGISYAMTGLGAAWLMNHFAGFKLTTAFLDAMPDRSVLEALGFWQDLRGANTWLVLPADQGVLYGAKRWHGIQCVHPVQAYMDLKGLPERAGDAAQHLRTMILTGAFDADQAQ